MSGVRILSAMKEVADVELSDAKQHLRAVDDQVVIITETPNNVLRTRKSEQSHSQEVSHSGYLSGSSHLKVIRDRDIHCTCITHRP